MRDGAAKLAAPFVLQKPNPSRDTRVYFADITLNDL